MFKNIHNTMKQPAKPPQEPQKSSPEPRLKVPDNLPKMKELRKLVLSRVGVSDDTASTSRNFMRSRVPHVQNSKSSHAILAAEPPILGALFSVLEAWNWNFHQVSYFVFRAFGNLSKGPASMGDFHDASAHILKFLNRALKFFKNASWKGCGTG